MGRRKTYGRTSDRSKISNIRGNIIIKGKDKGKDKDKSRCKNKGKNKSKGEGKGRVTAIQSRSKYRVEAGSRGVGEQERVQRQGKAQGDFDSKREFKGRGRFRGILRARGISRLRGGSGARLCSRLFEGAFLKSGFRIGGETKFWFRRRTD